MKRRFGLALAMVFGMVFFAFQSWAADDTVDFTLDNPPALEVNAPADPATGDIALDADQVGAQTVNVAWTVTSNNGFDINFTGTSTNDDGTSLNSAPAFYKQDVDADGLAVADHYDTLATNYGVAISGQESVETGDAWGTGAVPTGTPTNLVLALAAENSPDEAIGTIMTGDATGTATVTLYAKGASEGPFDQSGDYSVGITLTVTQDEQEL